MVHEKRREGAKKRVLVVTPTYNERENLEPFVAAVFHVLPDANVLVVDDGSPDGTGALADVLASRDPRVTVHHRPRKLGLGTAYLEAFAKGLAAGYDILIEMDTDFSHDPAYLPDFLAEIERGADIVSGSRNIPGGNVEGWGFGRHLLSKGGSFYARTVLGLAVRDLTTGYKAFTRHALETIDLSSVRSEGYAFQVELTYRAVRRGLTVKEIPIVFVDRRAGKSKMSRRVFAEAAVMVPRLRWLASRGKLG
jgi:dolichol-phosphate mannosyltransferase